MYDLCNYVIMYVKLKLTSKAHNSPVRLLAWTQFKDLQFPRRHSTGSFTIHTKGGVLHSVDRVF
jgi:hypothetical protein